MDFEILGELVDHGQGPRDMTQPLTCNRIEQSDSRRLHDISSRSEEAARGPRGPPHAHDPALPGIVSRPLPKRGRGSMDGNQ